MNIVILAGGSGTRLWPLSRKMYPKQLLSLIGDFSLIQNTALRTKNYPTYVVTNEETSFIIEKQLKDVLPSFYKENVIIEPVGMNTAPAIAYATTFFNENDIIAILPSDHYIQDEDRFLTLLKEAEELAKKNYIVTFGITPSRPETGYGYIQTKMDQIKNAKKVHSFKEKPPLDIAQQYVKDGNYFWNSGMFVFSVKTMKEELEKHSKDIYNVLMNIKGSVTLEEYQQFPSISIDYAVMEKTDRILLLEADMGWNDIGGFEALYDNLDVNKEGNAIKGNVDYYGIHSENNLVYSSANNKIVASIGINDMVIVDTEDALLVANKKDSQLVKNVVEELKEKNRPEINLHKKVHRPWGYYTSLAASENYQVKEIVVYPGQRLSLQSHEKRCEQWTIIQGKSVVTVGDKDFEKNEQESIFIPKGTKHRLSNPSDEMVKIIEVQMGTYFGEDDIVRYEDDYGRVE